MGHIRLTLLWTALFLTGVMQVKANMATPFSFRVESGDGKSVELRLHGDEYFHYMTTTDGVPVVETSDGEYHYATVKDGRLVASGVMAADANMRTAVEKNLVEDFKIQSNQCVANMAYKALERRDNAAYVAYMRHTRAMDGVPHLYEGVRKGLAILVEFDDEKMTLPNPGESFNNAFNQPGYNKDGHVGSVRDYFIDQSYGKFRIDFDVVGPVKVSGKMGYYGGNDPSTGSDRRVGEMIAEACRLVNNEVDFRDYDWDGDGEVEQVYVIYAGYAESSGAPANTIWPHKHVLTNNPENYLRLDGVVINTYACSSELSDTKGGVMDGIGTVCHEFSHCMGLPDMYDVSYSGGVHMQYWDVMASGSYSGPEHRGEVPCGYTAYERWLVGWLQFTDLNDMCRITEMPSVSDRPVAYRIMNDNCVGEYFILENRQPDKWFGYYDEISSPHGMLITHVDYDKGVWEMNKVNVKRKHQRFSFVPADCDFGEEVSGGKIYYRPDRENVLGDLFPGYYDVCEFTDESHAGCGGKWFNADADGSYKVGKPVTNIREENGFISFDFMGGIFVAMPDNVTVTACSDNSMHVSWSYDAPYDSFEIEAVEQRGPTILELERVNENFENFKTVEGESEGIKDLSQYIDSYTTMPGWQSENVFTSKNGVRLGTETSSGYLMTYPFATTSQVLSVKISATSLRKMPCNLKISLVDNTGKILGTEKMEIKPDAGTKVLNFTHPQGAAHKVRVESDMECCLTHMSVYDGNFTAKDLSPINILIDAGKKPEIVSKSVNNGLECIFEDLKPVEWKCRVRACYDNARSEWTELAGPDLSGMMTIKTECEGTLLKGIYDISGHRVHETSQPGIYIYDYGDRHVKKVVGLPNLKL